MPAPTQHASTTLATLVSAARSGDSVAWTQLVERFDRMLRSVARSYRLAPQDVDDAVQATWVKLYEHIDRLRDSEAIAGWLATTVRREALRLLQRHVREHITQDPAPSAATHCDGPEAQLLARERRHVLGRALSTLPDRQRKLMTLLASESAANYEEIGAALDMPVGSIGPIRARGMARLQRHPELRAFAAAS